MSILSWKWHSHLPTFSQSVVAHWSKCSIAFKRKTAIDSSLVSLPPAFLFQAALHATCMSLTCHTCSSFFNDSHCMCHSLKLLHLVSKDLYDQTQSHPPQFSSTYCFLIQTCLSPQQPSGMTDSFLAWSLHRYALWDAFTHVQPFHLFFIGEILIKGPLRLVNM